MANIKPMANGGRMWMYGGTIYIMANSIFRRRGNAQVLKYFNRDNNKGWEGTENCDEEQTKQLRSRTAKTKGFISTVG